VRRLAAALSEAIRAEGIRTEFFSGTDEPETLAGKLLFSALSAAALAQTTDEPSDHEHGQQESDDHACADEHINGVAWKKRPCVATPIWLPGPKTGLGHVFACLLGISLGMGGAFFRAFVPAAKALSGAYEEGITGTLTIGRDDQGRQLLAA
jgi:hypothetical protein